MNIKQERSPPKAAVILCDKGCDAVGALEVGMVEIPDAEHLAGAAAEQRARDGLAIRITFRSEAPGHPKLGYPEPPVNLRP